MHKLIYILFFFLSTQAIAIEGTGLEVSLAGDMVYDQGLNDDSSAAEKLTMRGAEMMFYAPIDHRFDGTLSAAAHDENGETVFELHELFLGSSKMIPRGRFKIGQFFLGVGRLNQFHQHDWPFIRAPKVHETFFDSEGVFDAGAEVGYLLPTHTYLDVTLGVTSGHRYGHAHTSGSKPLVPTHYIRVESFKEFSSTDGMKIGASYLGRTDEQKNRMNIVGYDFVSRWRTGKKINYFIQSEGWFRSTKTAFDQYTRQAGLYLFNQFGIDEFSLIGIRLDGYKDLTKENSLTLKRINNVTYALSPEYTWKSSEFATWRFGFSHEFTREEGDTSDKDTRIEAQFVFILGAHPAHSF